MADAKEEMTARAEAKGWLDPISGSFSSSTSLFTSSYFIYSSCFDLSPGTGEYASIRSLIVIMSSIGGAECSTQIEMSAFSKVEMSAFSSLPGSPGGPGDSEHELRGAGSRDRD